MTDKNKDPSSSESMNTRWWESYLVRYFIGLIVGAGCVATIASQFLTAESLDVFVSVSKDGKPDWSAIFWVLSLAGLGYCYIASTPITVLHAGRYGGGPIDSQSRYFWLGWTLALLVSSLPSLITSYYLYPMAGFLLFIFSLLTLMYISKKNSIAGLTSNRKKVFFVGLTCIWLVMLLVITLSINFFLPFKTPTWVLPVLVMGYPIVWVGFAQYAVLWRLLFEQDKVETFYTNLFHARRQTNARDVRDTYTHLREHSNSVFIVLIELCLLALIYSLLKIYSLSSATLEAGKFFQMLGIGMVVWVLPTVFMWSRANAMERSFGNDPNVFLRSGGAKAQPPCL